MLLHHLHMPGRAVAQLWWGFRAENEVRAALLRAQAADVTDALSPVYFQDFSVIMAAIRSHPSQREVRLELQRCDA